MNLMSSTEELRNTSHEEQGLKDGDEDLAEELMRKSKSEDI